MMRSAATAGVMVAMAVTIGTLSTLAARAGVLPAGSSEAGSGVGAGVRVQITDDTLSAHSGDIIDYTVRVENNSSVSYPNLEVFHLVPAGFQLVDSTPSAAQEGSTVHWTANAEAGRTLVFSDQVMAGTVEESEHLAPRARDSKAALAPPSSSSPASPSAMARQFTSTACARGSATGPALACATVREQLTDGPDAASGTGPGSKRWQPGLLGIGLLAALLAAFGGFFRKRRDRVEED